MTRQLWLIISLNYLISDVISKASEWERVLPMFTVMMLAVHHKGNFHLGWSITYINFLQMKKKMIVSRPKVMLLWEMQHMGEKTFARKGKKTFKVISFQECHSPEAWKSGPRVRERVRGWLGWEGDWGGRDGTERGLEREEGWARGGRGVGQEFAHTTRVAIWYCWECLGFTGMLCVTGSSRDWRLHGPRVR